MVKRITSRPSFLGYTNYYDEHGKKIGSSRPGLLGMRYFDEKGRSVGYSHPGIISKEVYYDNRGHRVGSTRDGILGDVHFDERGHRIGYTRPGLLGYSITRLKEKNDHHNAYTEITSLTTVIRLVFFL